MSKVEYFQPRKRSVNMLMPTYGSKVSLGWPDFTLTHCTNCNEEKLERNPINTHVRNVKDYLSKIVDHKNLNVHVIEVL